MNIFVLHERPFIAAQYHNDRHCVKMILETAQLLCTAHVYLDGEQAARANLGDLVLRPTHVNHPCAKWARECSANYEWLHALGLSLLIEYHSRYQKVHSYHELLKRLERKPWNLPVSDKRTPWPLCMPTQYHRSSAVEAYRLYYFYEKRHLGTWKSPTQVPSWWKIMQAEERKMVAHTKEQRA